MIFAIYASPQKKGSSAFLLDHFLKDFEGKAEIKKYYVYDHNFSFCQGCLACQKTGQCCYHDLDEFYQLLIKADLILISSPLYFSSFPAPLKAIIDRCQCLWQQNSLKNFSKIADKRALLFLTAGSDYPRMFLGATNVARHFFNTICANYDEKDFFYLNNLDQSLPVQKQKNIKVKLNSLAKKYSKLWK